MRVQFTLLGILAAAVASVAFVASAPHAHAQVRAGMGVDVGAGTGTSDVLFEPRNLPGAERYENVDVPFYRATYRLDLEGNGYIRVRGEITALETDETTTDHSFSATAFTPFILEVNLLGGGNDKFWIGGGIHMEDMSLTRFATGDTTTVGYTAIQFNIGVEFGGPDTFMVFGGSMDIFMPIDAYAEGPGLDGFTPAASIDFFGAGSPSGDPNEEVNDPYFGFGLRLRAWASFRLNSGIYIDVQFEASGFDLSMVSDDDPLAPVTPGTERLLVFNSVSTSVGVRIPIGN
jgi:hypothetical protein